MILKLLESLDIPDQYQERITDLVNFISIDNVLIYQS